MTLNWIVSTKNEINQPRTFIDKLSSNQSLLSKYKFYLEDLYLNIKQCILMLMKNHSPFIRIVCYWVALLQDPLLGHCMGAHDASRTHDAVHPGKNKVSLQGPLRKVYSI